MIVMMMMMMMMMIVIMNVYLTSEYIMYVTLFLKNVLYKNKNTT